MESRRAAVGRRGVVALVLFLSAFLSVYQVSVLLLRGAPGADPLGEEEEEWNAGGPARETGAASSGLPAGTGASGQTGERGGIHSERALSSSSKGVRGVVARPVDLAQKEKKKRYFHTAMTCDGSPYVKWQSRIMYFYYKKYKDHPDSEMGGFTRVLHSGKSDDLMDEIPTFVVEPLGDDKNYVVLNRPWAFVQWLQKATIKEEYILMAEPDHIIVKPIPNMATRDMPCGYPFFYIAPKDEEKWIRRKYKADVLKIEDIDPIGNSPSIVRQDDLKKIAPLWMNVSFTYMSDPVIVKQFEWVLEMYAYATTAALLGYKHILRPDFMVQPPWSKTVGDAYIIHYTYGNDFELDGTFLPSKVGPWHFDKRDYNGAIPRNLTRPPKGSAQASDELILRLNEATASMDWKEGAT